MKPHRLTIKGLLAFPEAVTVDFDAMPAGVYAVWGRNGAGKTTLIESLAAPIYREFPSRKKGLPDYATRRDAMLELDFDMGDERLLAHVDIDNEDRTTSALLESIHDGVKTALNDGKVKTYDPAMLSRVPPLSQLLASAFGIQSRKGSFVQIDQTARKDLFQRLIGAERYTKLAAAAKTKRDASSGHLQTAQAVAQALAGTGSIATLAAAATAVVAAEVRVTSLSAQLASAQEAHAASQKTLADTVEELRAAEALSAAIAQDKDRHADIVVKVAAAVKDVADLGAKCAVLPTAEARARALAETCAQIRESGRDTALEFDAKIHEIDAALELEPRYREAAERVAALRLKQTEAETALANARVARVSAAAALVAANEAHWREQQHERDLATLDRTIETAQSVPCHGAGEFIACRFLTDVEDAKRQRATARPPDVAAAAEARENAGYHSDQCADDVVRLEDDLGAIRYRLRVEEPEAAKLSLIEPAKARRQDLETARATSAQGVAIEKVRAAERDDAAGAAIDALVVADHRRSQQTLAGWEREQVALETHRAQWDSIDERLATAQRLHALHEMTVTQRGNVASSLLAEHAGAVVSLQHAEQSLITTRAAHEKYVQATSEADAHIRDVAEWEQFLRVFGRDGLPMIEIDQAGPAVTAHANMLLEPLFGGRFTLQLVTQVSTADGKAMKDVFDIEVFDGQCGGAKRSISDLSGGQQVIVDEVLKSAIALFMNQQNLQPVLTCIRDETTGALDNEVVPDYVALLRQVRETGGFHHLLFVTHNVDAAASADGILWVHDGQVDICYPPYDVGALESHQLALESTS